MVKEDIYGRKLKEGDYIVIPSNSTIHLGKVLKITSRWTVKLSCYRKITTYTDYKGVKHTYAPRYKTSKIDSLSYHNSYYYRWLPDFIIVDVFGDPVDVNKLYNYKKLIRDEEGK